MTLNEALVVQARELTSNLSGVVESLLTDFVEQERRKRVAKTNALKATIATWNEFNDRFGSFADEHSTL
jgi:antitoxin CcdA